jgi:lysophospholipase L1-like esterase
VLAWSWLFGLLPLVAVSGAPAPKSPVVRKSAVVRKATAAKKPATTKAAPTKAAPRKAAPRKAAPAKRRPARKKPVVRRASYRTPTPAMVQESTAFVLDAMRPAENGIENPGALVAFFEQLYQSTRAPRLVRILHYGDSHTASDDWPHSMRGVLQARFGDGGPGFVAPGMPFRGYRRWDARGGQAGPWRTEGVLSLPGDGLHGLGGLSLNTVAANAYVTLQTPAQDVELLFLQQPGGGTIELSADGQETEPLETSGELAPASYRFTPGTGASRTYAALTGGGSVRLLGWVAENAAGVTYESMGINGASANLQTTWDPGLHLAHLSRRMPALIVAAYGTNEALNLRFDPAVYERTLTALVGRFRAAAPQASILLVGPLDAWRRTWGGVRAFPQLDQVVEVQRRVASRMGCAFWDWRDHMGGKGAMRLWWQAGYAQGDYVHLTSAGYELTGRTLAAEILAQYEKFLTVRMESDR